MTTKMPALGSAKVTVGDTTYHLQELTADAYDECLQLATEAPGTDEERINNVLLVRLMAERCITEPSVSNEDLGAMGLRAHRKLLRAVNALHFGESAEDRYQRYLLSLAPEALSFVKFLSNPPEGFEPGND